MTKNNERNWSDEIYGFNVQHAMDYGLQEAIVIRLLRRWITYNQANNQNNFDGRTWSYNSRRAWQELLPFWSEKQVRSALESLREKGILITGNYNKSPYDKTLWYAFNDEVKFLGKATGLEEPVDGTCEANPLALGGQPIPTYINQLNNQLDSLGAHAPPTQPIRVYSPIVNTGDVKYPMEKPVTIPLEVIGMSKNGKEVYCKVSESQLEDHTIASNTSKLPTQQKEDISHQVNEKSATASILDEASKVVKMQATGKRIEWYIESRKNEDVTNENCPDDLGNWAMKEFKWTEDKVIGEWEKFCDYWTGKSGAQARKANWPGTWRNWCRKTADYEARYNNKQWSK